MSTLRIDLDKCSTSRVTSPSPKESWLKDAKRWELESILNDLGHSSMVIKDIADKNLQHFTFLKKTVFPALEMLRGVLLSNSHTMTEETKNDILEVLQVVNSCFEGVTKSLETLLLYAESVADDSVKKLANNDIEEAKDISYTDICEWFGLEQNRSSLP
jgi:hypothetical protein